MLFKKENMVKEKISASDLAASIYQSVCNGFGIQTSKEDEEELKATFDTLFGNAPVDVKSYIDKDGATVISASVNMCNDCDEDGGQDCGSDAGCSVLGSQPQYSAPSVAAAKDLIDRMDCACHCNKAQAIDELPKENSKMSLRDKIFSAHRVAIQKEQDEQRKAYETYLVDLITEKLETNKFTYLDEIIQGSSVGVLVEIDEVPDSSVVINVARILKADQGWSRIEYMQQEENNKTFLKFYF